MVSTAPHRPTSREYDRSIAGQVLTPEQHGAVGDGTADDTTALQNFLDDVASKSATSGAAVMGYMPGDYRITGPVQVSAHTYLHLVGRILSDHSGNAVELTANNDVKIDGSYAGEVRATGAYVGAGSGIVFKNGSYCFNISFQDLHVGNFARCYDVAQNNGSIGPLYVQGGSIFGANNSGTSGIRGDNTGGSPNSGNLRIFTIRNVRMLQLENGGIVNTGLEAGSISDNDIEGINGIPIDVYDAKEVSFSHLWCENCTADYLIRITGGVSLDVGDIHYADVPNHATVRMVRIDDATAVGPVSKYQCTNVRDSRSRSAGRGGSWKMLVSTSGNTGADTQLYGGFIDEEPHMEPNFPSRRDYYWCEYWNGSTWVLLNTNKFVSSPFGKGFYPVMEISMADLKSLRAHPFNGVPTNPNVAITTVPMRCVDRSYTSANGNIEINAQGDTGDLGDPNGNGVTEIPFRQCGEQTGRWFHATFAQVATSGLTAYQIVGQPDHRNSTLWQFGPMIIREQPQETPVQFDMVPDFGFGLLPYGHVRLNDDVAQSIVVPQNEGALYVKHGGRHAAVAFDAANGLTSELFDVGSNVAVTTGSLGGTSGTDGNFTVSADSAGNVYVENRTGSQIDFFVAMT